MYMYRTGQGTRITLSAKSFLENIELDGKKQKKKHNYAMISVGDKKIWSY